MGAREDAGEPGRAAERERGSSELTCADVLSILYSDVLCARMASFRKCTSFTVQQLVVDVLVPSQTHPFAFALDCSISAFK